LSGIVGILLAAGSSRRFGGDKLLHPLADGTPLLAASARLLAGALDEVIAVVRPEQEAAAALLRAVGVEVLPCARAEQGMGASIACGVAACADAQGWLIALGDMPFVRPATVGAVAAALGAGAPIAAPSFRGRRGHPVGFARRFGAELMHLAGDTGARQLLARHASELRLLSCDDAGVVRDVDVPADLAASRPGA
jgi:molybdenum cofactor cytidylyltransferase